MPDLITHHPVTTLQGVEIVPAGVSVERCVRRWPKDHAERALGAYPLLSHGCVLDDLLHLLTLPPYDVLFGHREETKDLLKFMERITVGSPILESLDYFREKDFYTYRHVLMVFALSVLLGRELIADPREVLSEASIGPMHDFGKICVPMEILRKSEPLTKEERGLLEHHAVAGYVLLRHYLGDPGRLAARAARDHHERRDGSGYPRGIKLRDFIIEIVAVSDVYDALISPRPYRPIPYENRTALEEITSMAQRGELSWPLVQVLVAYNRAERPPYRECRVSLEKRGSPPLDNRYGKLADEESE